MNPLCKVITLVSLNKKLSAWKNLSKVIVIEHKNNFKKKPSLFIFLRTRCLFLEVI